MHQDVRFLLIRATLLFCLQAAYAAHTLAGQPTDRLLADAAYLRDCGVAEVKREEIDSALFYLKRSLELNPLDADTHYWMGRAFHGRGQYKEASQSYKEAAHLAPNDSKIYLPLGIALRKSGDLGGAIAAYRKAIQLQADNADALNNLSWVLGSINQYQEAAEIARKAVQLNPASGNYRDTLACALLELGDLNGAAREINIATRLEPTNEEILAHAREIAARIRKQDAFVFDWKAVAFASSLFAVIGLALDRITLRRSKSVLQLWLMRQWTRLARTPIKKLHRLIAIYALRVFNKIFSARLLSRRCLIVGSFAALSVSLMALYRGLTLSCSLEQTLIMSGVDIAAYARSRIFVPSAIVPVAIGSIFIYLNVIATVSTLRAVARGGARRSLGAVALALLAAFTLATGCALVVGWLYYPQEIVLWGYAEHISRAWYRLLLLLVLPHTILRGQVTEIPMEYIFTVGMFESAPLATLMAAVLIPTCACLTLLAASLVIKPIFSAIRGAALYTIESATEGDENSLTIFTKAAAVATVLLILAKLSVQALDALRAILL